MKRLLVVGLLLLAVLSTLAAEVDEAMARTAIGNWRHRNGTFGLRMGERVRDVRRVSGQGVQFHVVRFEDGGVAIASADTRSRPVIMFSDDSDFDESPDNPAWDILKATLHSSSGGIKLASAPNAPLTANERAWAELTGPDAGLKYRASSIDDVRVDSLVKTRWNQGSVGGVPCYNYYTPNNYACGCTATAFSQIIRAFEYPSETTYVEPYENTLCKVGGELTTLKTQGGYYEWSKMPYVPSSAMTEAERKAIGKLTSDVGICLSMRYNSGGSGSWGFIGREMLVERFGYSSAMIVVAHSHAIDDDVQRIMVSNFDAKKPVQLDLSDHSILGDGYGYDKSGNLWYHLNFGWSGAYWYQPPTEETKAEGYTEFEGCVYNIFTTEDPKCVIASGRVTDEDGSPVVGRTVSAVKKSAPNQVVATATTDEHGIYAVIVEPGEYVISTRFERADRQGEKVGSVTANALKCVSREAVKSNPGSLWTTPKAVMGNAAFCDIQLETEYYPAVVVAIDPAIEKGGDFATATVTVDAQVEYWSEKMTKAAVVEVILTPVYGGPMQRKVFTIPVGDMKKHTFKPEFTGLVAGERYTITADIQVSGGAEMLKEAQTFAAREFTWFSESATTFADNDKWTYGDGEAQVQDGRIRILARGGDDGVRFTPSAPSNAYASREIRIRGTLDNYYVTEDELPVPSAGDRAAISLLKEGDASDAEVLVFGNGAWRRTDIRIAVGTECEISVSMNETAHTLTYRLLPEGGGLWMKLGEYALPVGTAAPSICFVGDYGVRSMVGDLADANFVVDANGVEYPTLEAAIAGGATGALSPLWKSTWGFPSAPGMFTVKDPNRIVTFTNTGNMLKSSMLDDGSIRYWCAQLDSETRKQALSYIETTANLGLVRTIITDASAVRIGDYLMTDGTMSFTVQVDDETVAKAAVMDLVEVSRDLADEEGWKTAVACPDEVDVGFVDGKVVVALKQGENRGFVRIRIPKQ